MFVKLRDKGSIFHDASQNKTVTGDKMVEVRSTAKVKAAIKGGVLVEVEDRTKKSEPAKEADKKDEKKGSDNKK